MSDVDIIEEANLDNTCICCIIQTELVDVDIFIKNQGFLLQVKSTPL